MKVNIGTENSLKMKALPNLAVWVTAADPTGVFAAEFHHATKDLVALLVVLEHAEER